MDIKELITKEEMAALMRISWMHDAHWVGGKFKSPSSAETLRQPIDQLLALLTRMEIEVTRGDPGVLPNLIQKAIRVTNGLRRSRDS
jgi:hypothetical protein